MRRLPFSVRLAVAATALLCLLAARLDACEAGAERSGGQSVEFAVLSDLHILAPSLCGSGKALERRMSADRKLITDGPELLEEACAELERRRPGFLIVCGDLTKDGERESHLHVARRLAQLKAKGVPAFVVPGNHDVLNGMARRYLGDKEMKAENVSPEDFAKIYEGCGYGQAAERDPASLSYAAQAAERLLVVGLDTCRYAENRPGAASLPDGMVKSPTLEWLKAVLGKARAKDMSVIVFMHHGLFEHFPGQSASYPQYLLRNSRVLSDALAEGDVRHVFTGHFHANDITEGEAGGRKIFDIETASLVTWPCSCRTVRLEKDGHAMISTFNMKSIPSRPEGFQAYAKMRTYERIKAIGVGKALKWSFSREDAEIAGGMVADAYLAHYQGDEASYEPLFRGDLEMDAKDAALFLFYKGYYEGLKTDLPPADLNIELNPN